MPEIRLYPQDDGGLTIPSATGNAIYLPQFRLRAWVRIGGEYALRQAILDTGAPASIFTKHIWLPLHQSGRIEWLGEPPNPADHTVLPKVILLRGQYPFRLGRVTVELADLDSGSLRPVRILVQCVEDQPEREPLPRLLILGVADLLHGRTLTLRASADGAAWRGTISE